MVIRFGRFCLLYIGKTTDFFSGQKYDAGITLCRGKRDAPDWELQWRIIWSLSWNWLPDRIYRQVNIPEPHLLGRIGRFQDSARWTGRDRKFIGFARWRRKLTVIRSTWRSKMFVYLTGSKERSAPLHVKYVAPAGDKKHVRDGDIPSDWINQEGQPAGFAVEFNYGRAEVDDRLGEYMISAGLAQRTNLIRSGKALLGSLASAIAGR